MSPDSSKMKKCDFFKTLMRRFNDIKAVLPFRGDNGIVVMFFKESFLLRSAHGRFTEKIM